MVLGDKSEDHEIKKEFVGWTEEEGDRLYWSGAERKQRWHGESLIVEERKERWHVESLVVAESERRKGVGRMLMREVMARAEAEGRIVGLEASTDGEGLYRSLGFEWLGAMDQSFRGEVVDRQGFLMVCYVGELTFSLSDWLLSCFGSAALK